MAQLHIKLFSSSILCDHYDNYLGAGYTLGYANAKELREYLLSQLKDKNIDYSEYNREKSNNDQLNPPIEIYEYQPFYLLKRDDGEFVLLDGFRRLLWYNAPDNDIIVRIYHENDLTNEQIMKLMVYLNHFKFYGGSGEYYDRGFSLALKVLFDLNIQKNYKIFNAYLTYDNIKKSFSFLDKKTDDQTISCVKERILNPLFIDDMKFIESLNNNKLMLNAQMGALIYQYRTEHPGIKFDSDFFINECKNNNILNELHKKYEKNGDYDSERARTVINEIIPLYKNIFSKMFGGDIIKTYSEKMDECKKILETLKKEKGFLKLTGNQKCYLIDAILKKRIEDNKKIEFKCLVYPIKNTDGHWNKDITYLEYGLLKNEIKFVGTSKSRKLYGYIEIDFGFYMDNHKYVLEHNYGSSGKKYTHIKSKTGLGFNQDIDVFVNVTKEEVDFADKNRNIYFK